MALEESKHETEPKVHWWGSTDEATTVELEWLKMTFKAGRQTKRYALAEQLNAGIHARFSKVSLPPFGQDCS